jgi:hypothetical protein
MNFNFEDEDICQWSPPAAEEEELRGSVCQGGKEEEIRYFARCYVCTLPLTVAEVLFFREKTLCQKCMDNDNVIRSILELEYTRKFVECFEKTSDTCVNSEGLMKELAETCFHAMRLNINK